MLSPLAQQDSSPESSPRRVRSLVDMYETYNMAMIEPNCYEEASKHELWSRKWRKKIKLKICYQDKDLNYYAQCLELPNLH
ncbi:hypothetical protein LR48_Vigan07g122100 [Vigna angularis]|uniref:Uncharacterized protein n=1 Tax=Phaseolus angularis TaxID=3914 RepID=A0A0L9UY62_PHAAN|nr:hypothetical protein LR48_Vigan07g122100 [Vigna angularis]